MLSRTHVTITSELIVLFIGITAIVEFIMMHISEEKMQKYLSGKVLPEIRNTVKMEIPVQ